MSEAQEVAEAELAEVIEGCGAYVTDAWRAAEELYASGWRKTGGDETDE